MPGRQGLGIGKALINDAIASLDPTWTELTVWTLTENYRALAFYAGLGFKRDGSERTDDFWRVPDVRLRKPLGDN
jgi:ribosomal protein S18 acetylase RimI-like enzyme